MSTQGVANGEHHITPQAGTPVHPKASVDARRLLVAQSLQVPLSKSAALGFLPACISASTWSGWATS